MTGSWKSRREGFSLVEVLVAAVLLTVGLLAMISASGYILTQIRLSGATTERAAVVRTVAEELRARPLTQVVGISEGNAREISGYRVWWDVARVTNNLRRVRIFTSGRDYVPGQGWQADVVDTTVISLASMAGIPQ